MVIEKVEKKIVKGTISPETIETIYLDELASRLKDVTDLLENIYNWLESTVTEGKLKSVTISLAQGVPVPVQDDNPWYECVVFNDGPDLIKVSHEESGLKESIDYNNGDSISLIAKKGTRKPVWLRCDSGTASVRVVFKR